MPKPQDPLTIHDRLDTEVSPEAALLVRKKILTPRKLEMIAAFVREGTYAAAAEASGFAATTCKKYLEEDEDVRDAAIKMVERAAKVAGTTLERVMEEYGRIAFADIGDVVDMMQAHNDPDEALAMLADLPPDMTAAISKVEMTRKATEDGFETGTFKVQFHSKTSALSDLARMLSMFNDKIDLNHGSDEFSALLDAAAKATGADE